MIKAIISDFSRVIIFPKDKSYEGGLNNLYREIFQKPNYNMFDYFELNSELLDFYKSLKNRIALYIFTSETIQEDLQLKLYLKPIFDNVYSAIKIGLNKDNSESYQKILSTINLKPEEVIYIDDNSKNIQAAKEMNINVIQYANNEDLFLKIKDYLN